MSAEIIEEDTNLEAGEGETFTELFSENSEQEQANVAAEGEAVPEASNNLVSEEEEPELAEKYRGKSTAEIVQMHRLLEQKLTEQGAELGSARQTLNAMALQQKSTPEQPEPEPISESDFFSNPANTVNRAIEEHPSIKQAQEMARKMALAHAQQELMQKHPDAREIVDDPAFKEWCVENPARAQRAHRAHTQNDIAEADDLIATWKALNSVAAGAKQVGKKAQKQAVRNASTGAVRGNSDSAHSKRVYRKRDLRHLKNTKPEEYADRNDEISQAYQEGRVR